ncbi:flagellar M-ring protein FliF [Buchnera aphidicola (Thelaxes californica)]|uniref:Flagellar M-ring protein n=1 Tax=Buchnera aphidicola (Thelaxes californica) TaxID=1315998 RepID=A0A4D6YNJ9_9GAMM|nr:flagellar basal-body MS-ring/collar protein FliF [Buchnera aphidicola]QCI26615.1 flagellar M-ring protein FliF [Buchnera aphidicola (Thelaxes californica)]
MNTKEFKDVTSSFIQNIFLIINKQLKFFLLLSSTILAIFFYLIFSVNNTSYKELYSHLSQEKSSQIINKLINKNIPYHFNHESQSILVPRNQLEKAFFYTVPIYSNIYHESGFELFDKEKFNTSAFHENINYYRAIEGELERTIQLIDGIKIARVHLSKPKESIFENEKLAYSAAIFLSTDNGELVTDYQVNSVIHLVSGTMSELKPEKITVIDQHGHLLHSSNNDLNLVNNSYLKYSNTVENFLSSKVEALLIPLFGVDNFKVKINADINFNTQEKFEEQYKPNYFTPDKAIRSEQIIQNFNPNEQTNTLNDVVSNDNKIMKTKYQKNIVNSNQKKNVKYNESDNSDLLYHTNINNNNMINYELNRCTMRTKINIGQIKKLSVAVIINSNKSTNSVMMNYDKNQLKDIQYLIQDSIGFSKKRGDSFSIVHASFVDKNSKINDKILLIQHNEFIHDIFNKILYFCFFIILMFFIKKLFFSNVHSLINNNLMIQPQKDKNVVVNQKKDIILNKDSSKREHDTVNNFHYSKKDDLISKNSTDEVTKIIRQWMNDNNES